MYFQRKDFLKSDTVAGYRTSLSLKWCKILVCLRNFNYGISVVLILQFHWLLARWDATLPHIPGRSLIKDKICNRGNNATGRPITLLFLLRSVAQHGKTNCAHAMMSKGKRQFAICSLLFAITLVVVSQTDMAISPLRIPAF